MESLQFSTLINAPRQKVWESLWQDANYREWTAAFMEGSYAETDSWEKGSKVLFMDAERNGMIAVVLDNRPNEFMSFHHLAELKKGEEVEDPSGKYGDNHENYTLKDVDGKTELVVDMWMPGAPENFIEYFESTWPTALERVKAIAERN